MQEVQFQITGGQVVKWTSELGEVRFEIAGVMMPADIFHALCGGREKAAAARPKPAPATRRPRRKEPVAAMPAKTGKASPGRDGLLSILRERGPLTQAEAMDWLVEDQVSPTRGAAYQLIKSAQRTGHITRVVENGLDKWRAA